MSSLNGLLVQNNFDVKGNTIGVPNGVLEYNQKPFAAFPYTSLDIINEAPIGSRNYVRLISENTSSWINGTSVGPGKSTSLILSNVDSIEESATERLLQLDFDPTNAVSHMYIFKTGSAPGTVMRSDHNAVTYDTETITLGEPTTTLVLPGAKLQMNGSALGDILYNDGTGYVRLPIGSAGQVLTVSAGGIPSWV